MKAEASDGLDDLGAGAHAQLGVEEERGALAAAVNHYDYLIQNHFSSELVPDAMLRSGRHAGSTCTGSSGSATSDCARA